MSTVNDEPNPPPPFQPNVTGSELSTTYKMFVSDILEFLKRPQDLETTEDWPCNRVGANIMDVKEHIVPEHYDNCPPIPKGFAAALSTDFRKWSAEEISEHFFFSIDPDEIKNFHVFWQLSLYRVLRQYAKCRRYRKSSIGRVHAVCAANLMGEHANDDSEDEEFEENDETQKKDVETKPTTHRSESHHSRSDHRQIPDLQKSIQAMTTAFPVTERVTGEETEPFFHRLNPILQQIKIAQIPDEFQVSVLYSLLIGKAREAATKISMADVTLDEFVKYLAHHILFEPNIQARKISRWNNITYSEFKTKFHKEHEASSACLDHLKNHHKDLPDHMSSPQILLNRIRDIFKDEPWCTALYERSSITQNPEAFSELIKTAASNADDKRQRNAHVKPSSSFPVTSNTEPDPSNIVAAFFAKTPPPPRYRRPHRYRRRSLHQYRQPSWMRRAPPSFATRKKQLYVTAASSPDIFYVIAQSVRNILPACAITRIRPKHLAPPPP